MYVLLTCQRRCTAKFTCSYHSNKWNQHSYVSIIVHHWIKECCSYGSVTTNQSEWFDPPATAPLDSTQRLALAGHFIMLHHMRFVKLTKQYRYPHHLIFEMHATIDNVMSDCTGMSDTLKSNIYWKEHWSLVFSIDFRHVVYTNKINCMDGSRGAV